MPAKRRLLGRRSFLSSVIGSSAAFGSLSLISTACAQNWSANAAACSSGITDSDSGTEADPVGDGQGTGVTDSDTGTEADAAGYGRGPRTYTDRDRGQNADPAGEGRGPNRVTDIDTGWGSDPVGQGQGGDRIRAASSQTCENPSPASDGDR